jgi:PPOX class probable F420-dependent enzyme
MSELDPAARKLLDTARVGTLATSAKNGTPRQSLVYFARDGDTILISTESKRLKARDVVRTSWASLAVRGDEQPFPSLTVSGPAEIRTEDIGPPTAAVMQRILGSAEPPPEQTDEDLAGVDRVILALKVERVSAANYLDQL